MEHLHYQPTHIDIEQLINLSSAEVQSSLVCSDPRVCNETIETGALCHNSLKCLTHARFICDIRTNISQLSWEELLERRQLGAWRTDIKGVDAFCTI